MKTKARKRQTIGKLEIPRDKIDEVAKTLVREIEEELSQKNYASTKEVLKLVGAGLFLAGSLVAPNLPRALKPCFRGKEEKAYKRFNLSYLKRALKRLEKQRLVEIKEEKGVQIVKITDQGRLKILRFALNKIEIKKPTVWNGKWWLVSYDIPKKLNVQRKIFREHLKSWGFYMFHESLFLHAYPCQGEIEFLREYLEVSQYVRLLEVKKFENDKIFREFFGV